jgi:hypothetical protein
MIFFRTALSSSWNPKMLSGMELDILPPRRPGMKVW